MKNNAFPHHSGGVVQVKHNTRFGVVPEALLEDRRLALDSRLVAAWLAVKQDGWQILVWTLRTRLVCGDQEALGKDRWQRIAKELESAGYLSRRRMHGANGRWNWHITFSPVPEHATGAGKAGPGRETIAGSAGCGPHVDGSSTPGHAGGDQPGHKVIPKKEILQTKIINIKTTTKHDLRFSGTGEKLPGEGSANEEGFLKLHYPQVSALELIQLREELADCTPEAQQDVLDEIEGLRRTGGITRGAVALAKGLVAKVAINRFTLSAGHVVRNQRENRLKHAMALEVAAVERLEPLLAMSDKAIDALPPNIARLVREHAARRSAPQS